MCAQPQVKPARQTEVGKYSCVVSIDKGHQSDISTASAQQSHRIKGAKLQFDMCAGRLTAGFSRRFNVRKQARRLL